MYVMLYSGGNSPVESKHMRSFPKCAALVPLPPMIPTPTPSLALSAFRICLLQQMREI